MRHLANASRWKHRTSFSGVSAPTELAIVHWIGCINAIKTLIYRFLWGSRDKIKRTITIGNIEQGGLASRVWLMLKDIFMQ